MDHHQSWDAYVRGIGVSAGVLLLIAILAYCKRRPCLRAHPTQDETHSLRIITTQRDDDGSVAATVRQGLDDAILDSFPKLLYAHSELQKATSTASCCSICLVDYKDTDLLRLLPECNHLFHLKCVDPWLRLKPTCPMCRNSSLQSPLATPLAEVVPLAARPC
ncbi:hypothetical protein FNV43_RR25526 [Rhamnella rubrinervis]|uniref:RING-type E3 ubiquitin transferase n=1 Tax=Rhamnella rubrinervis TaxID=2594499 RepID=A0A8K0DSL0_9ROSA|nr:hypothetical protein FNV43_RR25526 [Rhamnella rubrinervis]